MLKAAGGLREREREDDAPLTNFKVGRAVIELTLMGGFKRVRGPLQGELFKLNLILRTSLKRKGNINEFAPRQTRRPLREEKFWHTDSTHCALRGSFFWKTRNGSRERQNGFGATPGDKGPRPRKYSRVAKAIFF